MPFTTKGGWKVVRVHMYGFLAKNLNFPCSVMDIASMICKLEGG